MFRSIIIVCVLALFLNGCASWHQPAAPESRPWQQQQTQLAKLKEWQIQGQIAIITKQERHSASLYWQHLKEADQLRLTGPLGSQLLNAAITEHLTTIDSDGKHYSGPDASALIAQLTGWQLPVSRLPDWMIGLPVNTVYQLNDAGQLDTISTVDGWTIHYTSFQQVDNYVLPYRLEVERDSIKIKLKINRWLLEP